MGLPLGCLFTTPVRAAEALISFSLGTEVDSPMYVRNVMVVQAQLKAISVLLTETALLSLRDWQSRHPVIKVTIILDRPNVNTNY